MGGEGLTAETQCADGTYTNTKGQSTCLFGAPGYYVVSDKTRQVACAMGETLLKATKCDKCQDGSYAASEASPSCKPADKGYYVSKMIERKRSYATPPLLTRFGSQRVPRVFTRHVHRRQGPI